MQGTYTNANPYSDQMMGGIQTQLNSASNGMSGAMNNVSNYATQATGASSRYNPNAAFGNFMTQAPALENLSFGAYSPLQSQLNQQATYQSGIGAQAAAAQMGATGNLHSGAASRAIGQAQATPFAQVQSQLGGQQISGAMNLMNQNLGQQYGATQYQNQAAVNAALGAGSLSGQQAGTYAGLVGQGMDVNARLGTPLMTYQKSPWENFMGGLGDIASIAGTAVGAATGMNLGGGLGGLSSLFGGGGGGGGGYNQPTSVDPYYAGGGYNYSGYSIGGPRF